MLWMVALPPGQEVVGWMKFQQDYGIAAGVMLMLAIFGLCVMLYRLQKLLKQIDTMASTCEAVARLTELLITHDAAAQDHYSDVRRLTDDDHWKNCPVDKCPNLQQLTLREAQVVAKLEQFGEQSSSADERTRAELSRLATELHNLALEIIASMRFTRRNGNGKADHETE